jgi:hypothetical protein
LERSKQAIKKDVALAINARGHANSRRPINTISGAVMNGISTCKIGK